MSSESQPTPLMADVVSGMRNVPAKFADAMTLSADDAMALAQLAGDIHTRAVPLLRQIVVREDQAQTARNGLRSLLGQGFITDDEATSLHRLVDALVLSERPDRPLALATQLQQELGQKGTASPAALLITETAVASLKAPVTDQNGHPIMAISLRDVVGAVVGTHIGGPIVGIFLGVVASA